MYNTKNTINTNHGNRYSRKSDTFQQQHMSFVTPKSIQQSKQNLPLRVLSARGHQQIQTTVPKIVPHSSEENSSSTQDNQNIAIKLESSQSVEEFKEDKEEVKWPPKRKLNKKEQKKRLNARMRRLVCPKSPLMVFAELYKDVPIKLEEQTHNNCVIFTASIEIDGQLYTGDHVSKTQAKQKACENFLRIMLSKKMNERSNPEGDMEVEDTENANIKSKGPPQEDFPWPHFASLAMHNLISHWDLQPTAKSVHEVPINKLPMKIGGMKKFPTNPENYNPVQLLHQMTPGIKFNEVIGNTTNNPIVFETSCELNDSIFIGQGSTKRAAKRECAIATIKYFWNFDFHSVDKQ